MKKIAILGPIGNNIPPQKQGAIEWVVYYLVVGLVKKNYQVLLFAPATAQTPAELVAVGPKPMVEYKMGQEEEKARKLRIELSLLADMLYQVEKRKDEIGIIFNHTVSGGIFASLEQRFKIPVFHVLHLPLFKELAEIFRLYQARLISISDSQRQYFPALNYVTTIYNGIDLRNFPFSKKKEDFFIFASKINESKNPLDAIKAAKIAQKKLVIIGRINDQEYFDTQIRPLLDGQRVVYLGEVSLEEAIELYQRAKALLFPVKCPESFGLVMIEAMACGTPVIAYPAGATQEIIQDGKTGYLVKGVKGMAEAMEKIEQIDPRTCRKWVEENCSMEKMVEKYEAIVQKYGRLS